MGRGTKSIKSMLIIFSGLVVYLNIVLMGFAKRRSTHPTKNLTQILTLMLHQDLSVMQDDI